MTVPAQIHNNSSIARKSLPTANSASRTYLIVFFFFLLVLPIQPEVGGIRLDPYRVFLLLVLFITVPAFLSGYIRPFRTPDVLMISLGVWMVVTLVIHHGVDRLPYAITQVADIVGGYMLARLCLSGPEDFQRFSNIYFLAMLGLLPFAVHESTTGGALIIDFFSRFVSTIEAFGAERGGFFRAQVVFPHSILFGLFCSMAFSNSIYAGDSTIGKLFRSGVSGFMTLLSLSSAAALSVLIQISLILWGRLTGRKWFLLFCLAGAIFLFLEIASNRGPFILLIETLTFDPQTGWWRVYIWEYGSQSVVDHPVIGIGLNDWARPEWMYSSSVDNFWLLMAMRYGLPGFIFMSCAGVFLLIAAMRNRLDARANEIRTGYVIGWVALALVLCTVHVWDSLASVVSLYFGAASAFLAKAPSELSSPRSQISDQEMTVEPEASPPRGRALPFSRYPSRLLSRNGRKIL